MVQRFVSLLRAMQEVKERQLLFHGFVSCGCDRVWASALHLLTSAVHDLPHLVSAAVEGVPSSVRTVWI